MFEREYIRFLWKPQQCSNLEQGVIQRRAADVNQQLSVGRTHSFWQLYLHVWVDSLLINAPPPHTHTLSDTWWSIPSLGYLTVSFWHQGILTYDCAEKHLGKTWLSRSHTKILLQTCSHGWQAIFCIHDNGSNVIATNIVIKASSEWFKQMSKINILTSLFIFEFSSCRIMD